MERGRRVNGGLGLGYQDDFNDVNGSFGTSSASSCTPIRHTSSAAAAAVGVGGGGSGGVGGFSYIEHPVSKFDTLAGVAIKYGVEVSDIKRLNGLVSDLQMFALKTLQIPLPGRHPPSPVLSNGLDNQGPSSNERTPPSRRQSDLLDSFQSLKLKPSPQKKVSPAMSSLQGYYGLKPTNGKSASEEGFEMAVYRKGDHYLDDGPFFVPSSLSPPPRLHRKSRSIANDLMSENGNLNGNGSAQEGGDSNSDKLKEKLLVRRCQKSEADFSRTPELLLKEETTNGGGFSAITGKWLALRPKSASRTVSGADAEPGSVSPFPLSLGDSSMISENINEVKKSPSASSLQDSENSTLASLWPLSLKPDLQAFSTAVISKPIFDGLPKPITGRKNKAALD